MKIHLFVFLFFAQMLQSQHNFQESVLSDSIQSLIGGQREVYLDSGRADLVDDECAYEIEWANNWKESIGQALWYGLNLNKKPAIILLLDSPDDYKYFLQLNSALLYAGLDNSIDVRVFPNDF